MPTLTISRDKGWADKFRTYRIVIDGESVGSIGQDEILRHEVAAGEHVVEAKIDWCTSGPATINVEGDTHVEVQSNLRGKRLFLGLPIVFGAPKKYLKIAVKA